MTSANGNAVQAQPDRSGWTIELCIVDTCCDHILNMSAGNRWGDQVPYQQPGDCRIAVGKVQTQRTAGIFITCWCESHARDRAMLDVHSLESGQPERSAIEGGQRVSADALFVHGSRPVVG